jgi:hypothetical protein
LRKILFQEEEGVATKQVSRREQLMELIWVGCDRGAKGTKLAARRRGYNGMYLRERKRCATARCLWKAAQEIRGSEGKSKMWSLNLYMMVCAMLVCSALGIRFRGKAMVCMLWW